MTSVTIPSTNGTINNNNSMNYKASNKEIQRSKRKRRRLTKKRHKKQLKMQSLKLQNTTNDEPMDEPKDIVKYLYQNKKSKDIILALLTFFVVVQAMFHHTLN